MNDILKAFGDWLFANATQIIAIFGTGIMTYAFARSRTKAETQNIIKDGNKTDAQTDSVQVQNSKDVVVLWKEYSEKQDEVNKELRESQAELLKRSLEKDNTIADLQTRLNKLELIEIEKTNLETRVDELTSFSKEFIFAFSRLADKVIKDYPVEVSIVNDVIKKYDHLLKE